MTNTCCEDNYIRLKTHLNDQYSDATIIFQDNEHRISMNLHRIVLAWQIPYFDRLFSFADNLFVKEFTVNVDDATVAELLILSFYGQAVDWKSSAYQFLQAIKLKSFFCLDIDIHLKDLYQIKVPADHFTLLLQVITLPEIKMNKRLLRTIRENLPIDYSWEGVNEEFKQMVLDKKVIRNKHMISASSDKTLKLWDITTGDCLQTYTGHTHDINSVVLTEDNQRMISASSDQTLKLWDLVSGAGFGDQRSPPRLAKSEIEREAVRTYTGHTGSVFSVVLTEDNQYMISASLDKTLKLWDLVSGACLKTYTGHDDRVYSVVLTEDNQHLISTSYDQTLKLWNLATGACLKTYTGHIHGVYSVVLTEDNQRMVSASLDKTLKLWDIATGACLQTYTGHAGHVYSLALTEDNQRMISASYDGTLKLWDLTTAACLKTYTGHTEIVTSVVLTEDNQCIISAGADKTLKLWDLSTGTCLKTYTGHTDWINSVVLTKDQD